jgi:hypothetical protein
MMNAGLLYDQDQPGRKKPFRVAVSCHFVTEMEDNECTFTTFTQVVDTVEYFPVE